MISFISLHVTPKQDYLHFIHFHSFPFLYIKTSNQCYLISFFSIHFPYLNTFHSFSFPYDHSIPFPYELPNEALLLFKTWETFHSGLEKLTCLKPTEISQVRPRYF